MGKKKVLVTGGTVFVSRYVAEYYVSKGAEVYVLNRGSKTQSDGVTLIQADRHALGDVLRGYHFDVILEQKPEQHIFNVGNRDAITVKEWVNLCYEAAGKQADFVNVTADVEQRKYFSFYDYEYYLDVTAQEQLMSKTKALDEGLREAFAWYVDNAEQVNRKNYYEFIDNHL